MKKYLLVQLTFIILIAIVCTGCASVPKDFKQQTLNDMFPILSDEQYRKLDSLNTTEEINSFLNDFWLSIDSVSGPANIYREEYQQRLDYANKHYPDKKGWGHSAQKRIYLLYGPPSYVDRISYTDISIWTFSTVKALEVWYYMSPAKSNSFPAQGDYISGGEKKFIFGDMTGSGVFKILFSSEDNADIDPRLFDQR